MVIATVARGPMLPMASPRSPLWRLVMLAGHDLLALGGHWCSGQSFLAEGTTRRAQETPCHSRKISGRLPSTAASASSITKVTKSSCWTSPIALHRKPFRAFRNSRKLSPTSPLIRYSPHVPSSTSQMGDSPQKHRGDEARYHRKSALSCARRLHGALNLVLEG
jgi:hypothetical protein